MLSSNNCIALHTYCDSELKISSAGMADYPFFLNEEHPDREVGIGNPPAL
jgi:hypothetical protein